MKNKQHQYELDILRLIGAISIVLFHYTFRGYAADNMSSLSFPLLGGIFKYGYLGIYLFFSLSGYTIVGSAQSKRFTDFVMARIVRLYPSFWMAVCLTSIAILFFRDPRYHVEFKQFIANLTMLSGYIGVKSIDGVYWFMFVILKFYFLISILILLGFINKQKIFAGIWLLLAVFIPFLNIPKIGFFLIPSYAPYFISGMISYSAKKEGWDFYKFVIMFTSLMMSLYLIHNTVPGFNNHYNTNLSPYAVYSLVTSIYVIMYLVSTNSIILNMPKYVAVLGAATYPLYLIHQIIGFMIFNKFGSVIDKYVLLSITITIMIVLAIIITRYIDPYIHRKMNRIFIKVESPTITCS